MSKKKQNSAYDRPLRKGIKRPAQKGSSRIESLRQELQANAAGSKEKTKVGQRNIKPIIIRSPASEWSEGPKESPHERPGNADGESPGHGRHMNSRQTLGQI